MSSLSVSPVGVVHSPFVEKAQAPRQGVLGTDATIEVFPPYADALDDLDGFDRVWVLFWFHQSLPFDGTKVQPPRSEVKRGVFATRSPHRPNPIGMSAVKLRSREGCILHISEMDLVDGTPVLDLKPYVAYADAFPDAKQGWLAADPITAWTVTFATQAEAQLAWLLPHGVDLRTRIVESLSLGPQPHAYRRIRANDDGTSTLALKEWRARFRVVARTLEVLSIGSGYRERELAEHPLHAAFATAWGS